MLNKMGYTKEIVHKRFIEASIHLQQKMKFRKVFVRAKHESSNNKKKYSSSKEPSTQNVYQINHFKTLIQILWENDNCLIR